MTVHHLAGDSPERETARHIVHMRLIMVDGAHAMFHGDVIEELMIRAHFAKHASHVMALNGWSKRTMSKVLTKHVVEFVTRRVIRDGACPSADDHTATVTPIHPAGGR